MKRETLMEMGRRYPRVAPPVRMKFKPGGMAALTALWIMHEDGLVQFTNELRVATMVDTRNWGKSANIVEASFPGGLAWKVETFLGRIGKDIEWMRLSTELPLNVLMTSRQKIQQDNFIRILNECYGNLNYDGLPEWSMQLMGEFEIISDIPQIKFSLEDLGTWKKEIILDSWSGQIFVDGIPQDAYRKPEEFHQLVLKLCDDHLEEMTRKTA